VRVIIGSSLLAMLRFHAVQRSTASSSNPSMRAGARQPPNTIMTCRMDFRTSRRAKRRLCPAAATPAKGRVSRRIRARAN
jgi:hypothetical protein